MILLQEINPGAEEDMTMFKSILVLRDNTNKIIGGGITCLADIYSLD